MIWNFCIRRPVLTVVVFLAIAIFGIYGYQQLPVREYPDIEFPVVNVSVVLRGADPEVIETEVVEPLEEELNTIEGIKTIRSTSREEVGTVTVEFELYRDIDIAAQDVRDRVSRARPEMADDIEEPIVRKVDPDARAVMWIALTGNERWDPVRITEYAENNIKERLEGLPGVGQIRIGGERRYAVRIQLDPLKLAAYRLTVQDVVNTIRNENVDIPSGRIESEMREFLVKTQGQFSAAQPFNDLILAYRDNAPVRLSEVGRAVDGVENDRTVARFVGEPSVGLGVVKQSDANLVALVERVRNRMQAIGNDFPPGLQYTIASDDSQYVRENIRDLLRTIFLATALVVAVILFFLGTFRGTLITSLAIPTSLLGGFAAIHYFGFSLNVLSMLGLILVIGIVVDDAIVVLESCFRHMEKGAASRPAARTGTTEIAFAAIANSLSLAAVFIPVAFMPGLIGRFFFEFGLTVAVTVFFSTFTALTLTPMLCSRFLVRPDRQHPPRWQRWTESAFGAFESIYRRILNVALRHLWVTVFIGAAAFAGGLYLFALLDTEFSPSVDRGEFVVSFETVEGASLRATDRYARKIEQIFSEIPEIRTYFLAVALGRTGPGQVNQGISFVRLTHRGQRQRSQQAVMQHVRDRIAGLTGVRAFVLEPGGPLGAEAPLQIVLKNPELDQLAQQQAQVMAWMRREPEYVGVNTNTRLDRPEVRVRIDRDRAAEMKVSVRTISETLRFIFGDPQISTIDRGSERYEVITEIAAEKTVPATIFRLYTRNGAGQMIPLESLVRIEEAVGPSEIHHFNRSRSVTLSAQNPPGVALGPALSKLQAQLAQTLPADFETTITGRAQDFRESFFYLTVTIGFSVIFVYLVLSAQFESFLHPFTILLTLPLAAVGASGALYVLGMTLNIFSFIGLILLVGLVTKTGILLVDYANVLRARGSRIEEAARQAAHIRFRPVIMTATSTVLGMLPIALGFGAGGNARAPMGVVIALGNFVSTALTLLVIPVAYILLSRLQRALSRHRSVRVSLIAATLGIGVVAGLWWWWR
ncbi:MAG TPA: efflux RND transporter permease subunit [Desulfobacterales bacterium]